MRIISSFLVGSILILLCFAACQKASDPTTPPDPTNPIDTVTVKPDSAFLISSYLFKSLDQSGMEQSSSAQSFMYDTVNRKIIMTHHTVNAGQELFPDGLQVIFSYNSFQKLTEIAYKFPPGFPPAADATYWITSIKYSYDDQQVVSNLAYQRSNGVTINHPFKKTLLAAGKYQLDWEDPSSLDTTYVLYSKYLLSSVFDASGKCEAKTITEYLPNAVKGEKYIEVDSIIYKPDGQVEKNSARVLDTLGNTIKTFIPVEVNSRSTKGDQISSLVKILFNGVIDLIGFDDSSSYPESGGILFSLMAGDFYPLLNGYPALSSRVYAYPAAGPVNNSKTYFDNTIVSKIDSLGRLTSFSVATPGSDVSTFILEITYFK